MFRCVQTFLLTVVCDFCEQSVRFEDFQCWTRFSSRYTFKRSASLAAVIFLSLSFNTFAFSFPDKLSVPACGPSRSFAQCSFFDQKKMNVSNSVFEMIIFPFSSISCICLLISTSEYFAFLSLFRLEFEVSKFFALIHAARFSFVILRHHSLIAFVK